MKFVLLIFGESRGAEDTLRDGVLRDVVESGEWLDGAPLADPALACTVRVRGGVTGRTGGAFGGAGAHLAGYWVVDCADLDRAVELAAGLPEASAAAVEVRPLMGPSGMEM